MSQLDDQSQTSPLARISELQRKLEIHTESLQLSRESLPATPELAPIRDVLEKMQQFAASQAELIDLVHKVTAAALNSPTPKIEGEPLNLLMLRHGRSVGNEREKILKLPDDDPRKIQYLTTPNYELRLITLGREQAVKAGQWMKQNLDFTIDAAYCPEFARSQETGGLAGLEMALPVKWRESDLFGERPWNKFEELDQETREREYEQRVRDPNHWTPPGGGSIAELKLGSRLALGTMHRKHCLENVLISTHGERMVAIRSLIERFSIETLSKMIDDGPPNGGIVHYTRKNPESGEIAEHFGWVRLVCPWDFSKQRAGEKWDGSWKQIDRPKYSSAELLERVARLPQIYDR